MARSTGRRSSPSSCWAWSPASSACAEDGAIDAVRFHVRLTPRGGADRVDGVGAGGELRVRVRAAPAEGEANAALRRVLADALHVPQQAVTLEAGAAARTKRWHVAGRTARELLARWPGLAVVDAPDPRAG